MDDCGFSVTVMPICPRLDWTRLASTGVSADVPVT